MVRFLHSSDWQLGMTRYFLGADAQARFTEARIAAIERLGEVARDAGAAFVVVAGDVFETNRVGNKVVQGALDAMRDARVPFYLLPGNHDPLAPGSVYASERFERSKPGNVHVLGPEPVKAAPGTWVAGVPWRSKQAPGEGEVAAAAAALGRCAGERVLVLHGQVERAPDAAVTLERAWIERAIREQGVGYVALGDRHSATDIGCEGRAWYSGAPEPTDYDELNPGKALLVDLDGGRCTVEERAIGRWKFVERRFDVHELADVERAFGEVEALPDPRRTILRLRVGGSGGPELRAAIEEAIAELRESFAAVEDWERYATLVARAAGEGWETLGMTGFAAETARELDALAVGDGEQARTASDALVLLYRLARERA